MSPTRRTILRTTGLLTAGALAGCTANGNADEDETEMPDEPTDRLPNETGGDGAGGTRPAGTGGPGISLRGVGDAPDLPVKPSVEVVRAVATDEHPPRLRVTLENASEERVSVGEGRSIFFRYVTDDTEALELLPADGDFPAEPGCWRLTDGIATTMEYRIVSLDPGESRSKLVDLYAAHDEDSDSCLPVGEYRFETTYNMESLSLPTDADSTDESAAARSADEETAAKSSGGETAAESRGEKTPAEKRQATWGFSLALE